MHLTDAVNLLKSGDNLTIESARDAMAQLCREETPDELIVAFLTALKDRPASGEELAGFAMELRSRAKQVNLGDAVHDQLIDTCGTGGGYPTFNISTGAAIVAAGAGAKIAKHGNRAVTSVCGSADVLEAAGVMITDDPNRLRECMARCGVAFLFAPQHHPALKRVGPIRKSIGFRTVFNQLGPLLNPAGAKRQLLGVYDESFVMPMVEALMILGSQKAVVARGHDGLDEISARGDTLVALLDQDNITLTDWNVELDFGMLPLDMLRVGPGVDAKASALLLETGISDSFSPYAQALLPNAATALWISGIADSLIEGVQRGLEAIKSGAARNVLEELRKA